MILSIVFILVRLFNCSFVFVIYLCYHSTTTWRICMYFVAMRYYCCTCYLNVCPVSDGGARNFYLGCCSLGGLGYRSPPVMSEAKQTASDSEDVPRNYLQTLFIDFNYRNYQSSKLFGTLILDQSASR